MRPLAFALLVLVLAVALALSALTYAHTSVRVEMMREVPACQEDEALYGVGEFEAGRWTAYECGPTDG